MNSLQVKAAVYVCCQVCVAAVFLSKCEQFLHPDIREKSVGLKAFIVSELFAGLCTYTEKKIVCNI